MLALSMMLTLLCVPNRVEAKGISVTYSVRGDIHNGKAKIIPDKEIWYAVGGKEYQSINIDFDGLNKDHDYEILNVKASNTKVIGKIWNNGIWYDKDYIESYDPENDDIVVTYARNGKASASFSIAPKSPGSTYFTYVLKDKKTGQKFTYKTPTITLKKKKVDFHAYHKGAKGYKKTDVLLTGVTYDFYPDVDNYVLNGKINVSGFDFTTKNSNLTVLAYKTANDVIQSRSAMAWLNGNTISVKAKKATKAAVTMEVRFAGLGEVGRPSYLTKTFTFYSPLKTMKMSAATKTVELGKTASLKATISPSTAYQKVTWSSNNTKVATVDKNGNVKGVTPGVTSIKAKAYNGKTVTCKVTVKRPAATKVQLSTTKKTMYKGQKSSLKASVLPSKASQNVTWSSSNKKIATVDKYGKVSAKATGSVTITAKSLNGKKAQCIVKVVNAPSKVTLNYKNKTLKKGSSFTLKATLAPKGTIQTVTWSTSNKNVVTVSAKGKVTAKKKGTAYIYARSVNGKKVSCKIVVR